MTALPQPLGRGLLTTMKSVFEFLRSLLSPASAAIDGFLRLTERLESRLAATEKRLDECEAARTELRIRIDKIEEKIG